MGNVIEVTQLNKVFNRPDGTKNLQDDELRVLSNVSFSIDQNEFISILGPSGCGKSTLLKLISGLDNQYDGSIMLNGIDPKLTHIPVCYMLQKDCLMPWRSMLSNILLPIEIQKGDIVKAKENIQPLLNEFGLSGFEAYKPNQLSGGMRQRAALMRTYLMEGDIMLLDEPFGALDEITRMQMQDWLITVWERHKKTVLFVTHNVDEAIFLSDRVLVMSNRPGTISGEVKILFERPRIREMLLGQEFLNYKKEILNLLSKC